MIRVLAVMALLAGLAAYVWTQAESTATKQRGSLHDGSTSASPTVGDVRAVDQPPGFSTRAPGQHTQTAMLPEAGMLPSQSSWQDAGQSRSPAIQQTAFFESSEPLPPGVDFPEGPQLQRIPATTPTQRNITTTAVEQPPKLLPPGRSASSEIEAPSNEDFVSLFNGQDLTGWVVQDGKPEVWNVADGVIRCSRASGGWLRTEQQYSDFELRFEVRLSSGANTGVGFRFPDAGSPTATGFELQLIDDSAPKYADLREDQYSGSLYYQLPPLQRNTPPVGEWIPIVLHVRGSHIRAEINGETAMDVFLDQLPAGDQVHPLQQRPGIGFVGLQSSGSPVEFRNLRLRDLMEHHPTGVQWVDLVAGTGPVCGEGERVTVDYRGCLTNGQTFDSSYDRGEPLTVALTDVIDGWQVGIPGMHVGGRRKLVIPAAQAYGDAGVKDVIPSGATLVFEVELRGIEH